MGDPSFFVIIGLFFLILYFFMIRPQTKKARDMRNFIASLGKGDRVVTIGGIHGRILEANEDNLLLEVDSNTKVKVERSAISLEFTRALAQKLQAGKTRPEKEKSKILKD